MTKHQDVNKCRQQEKCKMAALIRQVNKRVRNGQKATDKKKKKECMVKKVCVCGGGGGGGERENNNTF